MRQFLLWLATIFLVVILLIVPEDTARVVFGGIWVGALVFVAYRWRRKIRISAVWRLRIRRFGGWVCLTVGFGCLIYATWVFHLSNQPWDTEKGFYWFLYAIPWLFFAYLLQDRPRQAVTASNDQDSLRIRWLLLGLGAALVWLVAEIGTGVLGIETLANVSHHLQAVLWATGLVCIILSISGNVGVKTIANFDISDHKYQWWSLPIIVLICLYAFALRILGLDDTIRVFVDEMLFVEGVNRFGYDPSVKLYANISGHAPFTQFFTYIQSLSVDVFGPSFIGIRLPSAMFGTMTVATAYVLGRALFGRRTAIIGAFILASFPLHLQFSRLAINQSGDTFAATLAFAGLAFGWRYGNARAWVVGGIGLGLTAYFHEGARLLIPPVAVTWLLWGQIFAKQRPHWRGVLLASLVAILVAGPVYFHLRFSDKPILPRFDDSGDSSIVSMETIRNPQQRIHYLQHHLIPTARYHVQLHPHRGYFSGPDPIILHVFVPFFLLGTIYSVTLWRGPAFLIVIWLLANAVGNSLLVNSVTSPRWVATSPVFVFLMALGIQQAIRIFPLQRFRHSLLIIVVIVVTIWQAQYYFGPALDEFNRVTRDRPDAVDAVLRSVEMPPQTQVHIVGERDRNLHKDMLLYFRKDMMLYAPTREEFGWNYLLDLPCDIAHAIYLPPDSLAFAEILQGYPGIDGPYVTTNDDVPFDRVFWLYFLPSDHCATLADFQEYGGFMTGNLKSPAE